MDKTSIAAFCEGCTLHKCVVARSNGHGMIRLRVVHQQDDVW